MQLISRRFSLQSGICLVLCLLLVNLPVIALESDRQNPLDVYSESSAGFLGDGITTLYGNVDIRQGTLHITADEARINKVGGRVKSVTFHGKPAFLEQEIEEQGQVQATASIIEYQVASGIVTLTGNADVKHPQYQISGDMLTYDLNVQHFQGSSDENGNGRIFIQLEPEVIDKHKKKANDNNQDKLEAMDPTTPKPDTDN